MPHEPEVRRGFTRSRLGYLGAAALLIGLTVAAYWPALSGGFIVDDDVYLTDAPVIQAPDGLYRIWFRNEAQDFYPLSNTTLWLEWRLWGNNAAGYHVSNLILHVATALLLWAVLLRLTIPGAYLASLLFAVHPVNVESVAWIAQRKDVLAVVFFLLSILWYLRYDETTERNEGGVWRFGRWYWLSLVAFLLGMLSKGSVAILPLVLLVIVWWRNGRIAKQDLLRTAPFFLVAAMLTVVNIGYQTHGLTAGRSIGFAERLVEAGDVVWFYLSKALAPIHLIFIYPQWHIHTTQFQWWLPLAATLIFTTILFRQRNTPYGRPLLFAWLFFIVALAPVMGFTDVGFMQQSLVADHYQHIAVIAVVAIVAAAWFAFRRSARPTFRLATNVAAIGVVGILSILSWKQCQLYQDAYVLYQATFEQNPNSWLVHINLGKELEKIDQQPQALDHYGQAVRLAPENALAHYNLGSALARRGETQPAISELNDAVRLNPSYVEAHNNLGNVLLDSNHYRAAVEQFESALEYAPGNATTHYNLSLALMGENRPQEAVVHCQQAVRLRPDYAKAWNELAICLAQLNRPQEALAAAQTALNLARSQKQNELAQQVEAWINLQRAGSSTAP